MKALFDTSLLIDYLNAVPEAAAEIERYEDGAISIITWIEVMVGATVSTREALREFVDSFEVVQLDSAIAERAVALRQERRLKLPDAIIWATARQGSRVLVTRNTKDFPAGEPDVRHPYRLETG